MNIPPTGPFQYDPGGGEGDDLTFMPGAVTPKEVEDSPEPSSKTVRKAKATSHEKLSVEGILERARERLAELKTELEEMSKLKIEHDKLERLLAAADALEP